MDHIQPSQPTQQQEKPESASEYYSPKRKRSFFLSRITVITSMLVLVIALGINIAHLTSQGNTTLKSNAYSPANPQKNLPALPKGCSYEKTKKGLAVTCPTIIPTKTVSFPTSISLPKLPPQCQYATSATGSAVQCSASHTPIPTVAVSFPSTCMTTPQADIAACKNNLNQVVAIQLPTLPKGCTYIQENHKDYISCGTKQ